MLADHKAEQGQKLGWFRLLKELKIAFSSFPIWQFPPPPPPQIIKRGGRVLKETKCPVEVMH